MKQLKSYSLSLFISSIRSKISIFTCSTWKWLRTTRKCNHNSAIKYITNVKKIVLRCKTHGWLTNDPWALFEMTLDEVETVYLTKEELVRDAFVFSCLTGLAYKYLKKLKRSQLSIGVDGKLWIEKRRQKTTTPFKVPLLKWTLQLIETYKSHPKCKETDAVIPILSNAKYNDYLKEIAALCGIDKELTTHVARHTFATSIALLNGISLVALRDMLGHKKISQTEHYAKVLPIRISTEMKGLENKLEKELFLAKRTKP